MIPNEAAKRPLPVEVFLRLRNTERAGSNDANSCPVVFAATPRCCDNGNPAENRQFSKRFRTKASGR